ncbi:BOLA class I histocompatibility antigen, alpha chain BL3-7 [Coregonus clupeaformis]|uniref:BOLA class I histocompatibility antigen, alpha chain BL3-7 n=1 Tax=Coregonus clupeaformis TaxID=59861 RepID=UPI001E1C848D|nr:BOLA class I histocompatibility antigen, alpha chain BL3-7 [Coregonus clupeaformis]
MKGCILLALGILHTASAASHSLKYFYTAASGDIDFPEFTAVGLVDNGQFMYFDSNTQTAVPKTEWMKREGADYWDRQTQGLIGAHQLFKNNIQVAKDRFNQSKSTGVHVFQQMYGCEWDDDTGVTEGFRQYGYDGEDFIAFDLKTLTWIAPTSQALITKHKWDSNKALNEQRKHYLTQECIEWLKKYLDYGKSTLKRTVPPSVSLLQKTPSSPVTCHATGFYPSGVMVFWQKDGQDHHEDVEYGETLPNDDGTFQKSTHLTVTPEERKNNKYQCVVQVTGIKDDVIKVLPDDPTTNFVPIIGGVVALLLVIAVVVGVVIWKKKSKKGFVQTSTSDTDSDNSGKGAQKI